MKATFIESSGLTDRMLEHLSDDAYAALQRQLMTDPECGDVMKGCGGLRKVRTADPKRGKGKRGGAPVIYLHVPEAKWFLCSISTVKTQRMTQMPKRKRNWRGSLLN